MLKPEVLTFEGLGTKWYLTLFESVGDLDKMNKRVQGEITQFNDSYSRFLEESWIGRLNKNNSIDNPPDELIDIINKSIDFSSKTNGAFNIAIGKVMKSIGYDSSYSFKLDGEIKVELKRVKDAFSKLDSDQIEIDPNVEIDLGGIGKGYLVDKLVNVLSEELEINDFIINGGGDLYCHSESSQEKLIPLEHPFEDGKKFGSVKLQNGAITASSKNRRKWSDGGRELHHLIDLQKLEPKSVVHSVYVIADDATTGDVASTTLFTTQSHNLKNIASILGVEFLMVFDDGKYVKSDGFVLE